MKKMILEMCLQKIGARNVVPASGGRALTQKEAYCRVWQRRIQDHLRWVPGGAMAKAHLGTGSATRIYVMQICYAIFFT